MREKIAFIRLPILLLFLFFLGKLWLGAIGKPYALGNRLFSILTLAIHLELVWGAFSRRYLNYGAGGGAIVGLLIGLAGQIFIWLGTAGSYLVGAQTHFNDPEALNATAAVPFATAMLGRTVGLVINTVSGAIVGLIGWALGGLIPARKL